ncbi:MAG: HPr family phosphocarrier protein [Planococcus sp. (in: Bacteria)]|nr:HPr family phosphocarrier protein [Planococcus sp. (in: firmicutes)]
MTMTLAEAVVDINNTASKFESSIVLKTDNKLIDAKSMLGLAYSILHSGTFYLEIHGSDETKAKAEMLKVFWKYNLQAETNQ